MVAHTQEAISPCSPDDLRANNVENRKSDTRSSDSTHRPKSSDRSSSYTFQLINNEIACHFPLSMTARTSSSSSPRLPSTTRLVHHHPTPSPPHESGLTQASTYTYLAPALFTPPTIHRSLPPAGQATAQKKKKKSKDTASEEYRSLLHPPKTSRSRKKKE